MEVKHPKTIEAQAFAELKPSDNAPLRGELGSRETGRPKWKRCGGHSAERVLRSRVQKTKIVDALFARSLLSEQKLRWIHPLRDI